MKDKLLQVIAALVAVTAALNAVPVVSVVAVVNLSDFLNNNSHVRSSFTLRDLLAASQEPGLVPRRACASLPALSANEAEFCSANAPRLS